MFAECGQRTWAHKVQLPRGNLHDLGSVRVLYKDMSGIHGDQDGTDARLFRLLGGSG
jgi:hypothetical protein